MRVLILKTSSMGDVIHALPALSDAKKYKPSIVFDWVVEESFQEIPSWHPAVDGVIPIAIRRWRKNIFQTIGSNEWRQFKTQLRKHHYDLVIDCQGLLKSAWLGRVIKAPVAGYDKESVRESVATWFYQKQYRVGVDLHAVERIRHLFSQALGYDLPAEKGNYGIDKECFYGSSLESANVVFLHATTRDDKLYPEEHWRELAKKLIADGYRIRLPWGEEHEKERALRIAKNIEGIEVLPRLNLHGVACVLAQASAIVAVDTGLGHLSAALNIPTLSLYGSTNPDLVGAYGENQIHLCAKKVDAAADKLDQPLEVLTPHIVYQKLQQNLLSLSQTAVFEKLP
ncbi:MAG: lipopolysaccharide heptosyltransferase I [Cellvibrionaceae bacterium]